MVFRKNPFYFFLNLTLNLDLTLILTLNHTLNLDPDHILTLNRMYVTHQPKVRAIN